LNKFLGDAIGAASKVGGFFKGLLNNDKSKDDKKDETMTAA